MRFLSNSRQVSFLLTSMGVSVVGTAVALLAVTVHMSARGSYSSTLVVLADLLPATLLATLAGMIVDRYSNRWVCVIALSGQVVGDLVVVAGSNSAWVPYLGLFLIAAAGTTVGPCVYSLLPKLLSEDADISRAFANATGVQVLGGVVGSSVAGFLYAWVGIRWCLLIDAVSYCLAILPFLMMKADRRARSEADQGQGDQTDSWLAGVKAVATQPVLRAAVLVQSLGVAAAVAINIVDVYFVVRVLHVGSIALGFLGMTWAIGIWLGTRPDSLWSTPARSTRSVLTAGLVMGLALTIPMAWPNIYLQNVMWLIGGFCLGVQAVATRRVARATTPESQRGRVFAAMAGISTFSSLVCIPVVTGLLATVGPRIALLSLSATVLAVAAIAQITVRTPTTAGEKVPVENAAV
ncbi:MFS transporter [Streptomyces sp. NPDC088354]|uniref:MFS transporter n=1 Tax=Streptomyces sp. NPDC088354 TaxID=3365856 RepID=UPI0038242114